MASSTAFRPPRRSETVQQQEYEHQVLEQHYPVTEQQRDVQEQLQQDDPRNEARLPGQYSTDESQKSGVKGKLKSFWNKIVVPAFPEAVGDISLIKHAMRVEGSVIREIQDSKTHPEVDRVAGVRRGLELCPEEQEWLSARKLRVKSAFCRYMGLRETDVLGGWLGGIM